MTPLSHPALYVPFSTLRLGGNVFQNVGALVTVSGHAPLLIGTGEVPRVWLSAPGSQPGSPWLPLIEDNAHTLAVITVEAAARRVKVQMANAVLLNATLGQGGELVVHKLDLRPVGLEIFSDERGLHAMGNILIENEFHDVQVAMAIAAP